MAVTISQALVGKLGVDLKDFNKGMRRAREVTRRAARDVVSAMKTAAVSVAAFGTAAALLGRKIFELGSSALETRSKFTTVFGEATAGVQEFADEFGKLAGLTRSQTQEILATTGAIVQGMGFAAKASAGFAEQVVRLAGDLASFNNLPTAEVARAIQAAITGEREQLKRLGVVVREVDVQQRALAITGKTSVKALTDQDKATASLRLITERAGVAVGDLSRTQDSAANTGRRISAQFRQIAEDLSVQLLPSLEELLPTIEAIVTKLGEMVAPTVKFINSVTDAVGLTNPVYREQKAIIDALGDNTDRLAQKSGLLRGTMQRMTRRGQEGTEAFEGYGLALNLTLRRLIRLRTAAIETGDTLKTNLKPVLDEFKPFFEGAETRGMFGLERLRTARALEVGAAPDLGAMLEANMKKADAVTKELVTSIDAVGDGLADSRREAEAVVNVLATQATGAITGAILGFRSMKDAIVDIGRSILNFIIGTLVKAIAKALVMKAILSSITGGVGGFLPFRRGGMLPAQRGLVLPGSLPALATTGGGVPILAHPGEAVLNRDAVDRLGGSSVVRGLNRGSGGTGGILPARGESGAMRIENVNLSFPNARDEREIRRAVKDAIDDLMHKRAI
jgi:hypothetical protein